MRVVDLAFPIMEQSVIQSDHGYVLFSSLSEHLPVIHSNEAVSVHPIRGKQIGNRKLRIGCRSAVTLRIHSKDIAAFLPLAGRKIRIGNAHIVLAVPSVYPLRAVTALRSRLVTIKGQLTRCSLKSQIQRRLNDFNVSDSIRLHIGKRRTIRIKSREIVGYEVILSRLSADESLTMQEVGLGGRGRMGCGVFSPLPKAR